MEIKIPSDKTRRWSGPYKGNYYGDLWRTFNIDLDYEPGHISLSERPKIMGDSSDTNLLNIGDIDVFLRTNADSTDRWWGACHQGVLIKTDATNPTNLSLATWDQDTLANSPTDVKDMTIHENDSDSATGKNRLFATRDSDVASLNDTAAKTWNLNWWITTKSQPALKTGIPHPIEYFPFQRISIIGDGNLIHTIDKDRNISYARVVLPTYLQIWGIFTTASRTWILCNGLNGKNGAVVEWDGYSQTANYIHETKNTNPLSGVDYNGTPIVIDGDGKILEYNGNGFYQMSRNGQEVGLPLEPRDAIYPHYISGASTFSGSVSPRGMAVLNDGLIYINFGATKFVSHRVLGGIWCLNPINGYLYSKYSLSSGLSIDYGQQIYPGRGAIKSVKYGDSSDEVTKLLVGATTRYDISNSYHAIWTFSTEYISSNTMGHFITQFIPAGEIQEFWDTMWIDLSKFRSSNNKIIVKARGINPLLGSDKRPMLKVISWTSTTTFTTTLNAGDDSLEVGDEIEVVQGRSAGLIAHITDISGAHGALQTMTIDETAPSGVDTALCRFDRWKKLGTINNTSKYIVPLNIGITSSFIQFKVVLFGPEHDFNIKRLAINTRKQTINKK